MAWNHLSNACIFNTNMFFTHSFIALHSVHLIFCLSSMVCMLTGRLTDWDWLARGWGEQMYKILTSSSSFNPAALFHICWRTHIVQTQYICVHIYPIDLSHSFFFFATFCFHPLPLSASFVSKQWNKIHKKLVCSNKHGKSVIECRD